MPLIFASSLMALPAALARYADAAWADDFAKTVGPGGFLYLPVSTALIAFFNYYYTFLQVRGALWGGEQLGSEGHWSLLLSQYG